MTPIDPEQIPLGIPGGPQTSQWRLESIQLVNWGGFDGYHHVEFDLGDASEPGTTMITGESGTGKSTLMDAYIAVLMPNNTRFNLASNSVGRGKARGDMERTVLTYLQGKTDLVYDSETGENRAQVLRDGSCARWSAVVATFIDDSSRRFSAGKLYYLKSGCSTKDGYRTFMVTAARKLDPRALDRIADQPFDKRSIKSAFPDIQIYEHVGEYLQTLYTTLNIGAHGDGANAVELLVRVQSGYQITTVDNLFKELVLDTPTTYEKADRALDHFDDIEKSYEEMETARQKMEVLGAIPDDMERYREAEQDVSTLSSIGGVADERSPFKLWSSTYEADLLEELLEEAEVEKRELDEALEGLEGQAAALEQELQDVGDEMRANGSDTLARLKAGIVEQQIELRKKQQARAVFADRVGGIFEVPEDAEGFATLAREAATFRDGYGEKHAVLEEERDQLIGDIRELQRDIADLKEQGAYYESHAGNIPKHLNEAREAISTETGIDRDDLPFVGELIDIAPGAEDWRLAAETTLHGLARTMLVDRSQLSRMSRMIDHLKLGTRIHFQGVKLADDSLGTPRADAISGKLVFNEESPFYPWLHRKVCDEKVDALCVDSPTQLDGDGLRVTMRGQTRLKQRGAHGRNPREESVIGFDNRRKLGCIAEEIAEASDRYGKLVGQRERVEGELHGLEHRKDACTFVLDRAFEAIDVASAEVALSTLEGERDRLLAANDVLKMLGEKKERLQRELREAVDAQSRSRIAREDVERSIAQWSTRASARRTVADALTADGVRISGEQEDFIARARDELEGNYPDKKAIADACDRFFSQVSAQLARMREEAEAHAKSARTALERAFRNYRDRWPDNDLGYELESYDDYLEILEKVKSEGLYDRSGAWLEAMRTWIAEDLVPLSDAFGRTIRDIEDRVEPINEILAHYAFGTAGGHLEITVHTHEKEKVRQFGVELRRYASLATARADEDLERRHTDVRRFMKRLRPSSEDGTGERDELLDRKRCVTISVKAVWPAELHRPDSVYMQLGEKSGGEVQELVAFILGSALLFCLDDQATRRPGFAPVMLDEGFIKADAKFTRRAIQAWKGFGFQIIIATPHDKVEALIPFMNRYITITKDSAGHSFIAPMDAAPESTQGGTDA